MSRRGENIYRRKDGRYEGRYIKGYKEDRKPIFGYVYTRTYKECKAVLEDAKCMLREGRGSGQREEAVQNRADLKVNTGDTMIFPKEKELHIPLQSPGMLMGRNKTLKIHGGGTVWEFVQYWQQEFIYPFVKPSTYGNYAAIAENHILPILGDRLLCELEREDIQRFVNNLSANGFASGTVRNVYLVLHGALKKAEEYGYLYINPCSGIRLPAGDTGEAESLSLWEQKQLHRVAEEEKYGSAVLLSMYTGMRIGEICGLKWEDIDFDEGILYVSRTVQRVKAYSDIESPEDSPKTRVHIGTAKTRRSVRVIPLLECAKSLLIQLKDGYSHEYVFICKDHVLEPRVLQQQFKKILQKAGLGNYHFHTLRHTFATRCLEQGMDIRTLSEILGHASAKMTLDRYGHSQMEHKRKAMQSLEAIFEDIS